jgi:FkbM family methyltransferase
MVVEFSYPFSQDEKVFVVDRTCVHAKYTFPFGQRIWEWESLIKMGQLLNTKVPRDGIFVDVGAQVGLYSLAAKYFPQMTFHAFEPFPASVEILKENILANQLEKRVFVHPVALSNQCGTTLLSTSQSHNGLHTMGENPSRFSDVLKIPVQTVTLDGFDPVEKVDYLKIDTEGWEYFVLLGGIEKLKKNRPQVIQLEVCAPNLSQCGVSRDALFQMMSDWGYVLEAVVNNEEHFFILKEQ